MRRQSKETGSSLLEVVVSMAILAVGMSAALGMTRAGQFGMEAGRRISVATGLAQAKMEEKFSLPYAELLAAEPEGRDEEEGFGRRWSILPETPRNHAATILVETDWTDPSGRSHSMRFVTLRTEGKVP